MLSAVENRSRKSSSAWRSTTSSSATIAHAKTTCLRILAIGTVLSSANDVMAAIADGLCFDGDNLPADCANDNTIIAGITGSTSSLGRVGVAFAEENADKSKELAVSEEPGGECIAPTAESIADGSYPIARSLYIYVNQAKAAANPAVAAYVDYYLAEGTISSVLETVPYVNLPAATLGETRSAWDASK